MTLLRLKHTLPDLPYDYGALEPILSAEIMQVHHDKHHAAYVNALNQAEEKVKEALSKGWLLIHAFTIFLQGFVTDWESDAS